MRPVAANRRPFDLGEATAPLGMVSALCRWPGLILLPPLTATATSARRFKPLRERRGGENEILVSRPSGAPFAFQILRIPNPETEEAAG
jgi:hypothetical protein